MRVLVIGSGGREHAFVWKLRQSGRVRDVFCISGNGGIAKDARCFPVQPSDHRAVGDLVRKERIDLVLIGPEAPLAAGLADHLQSQGVPVVGPSKAAAQLESSKVFSKEFMARHGIPTATFQIFSDPENALRFVESADAEYPLVVKADGLAAGKGVIVCRSKSEAGEAVRRIMVAREFGSAGERVVFEEFLEGVEASFIVFTDGKSIVPAVPSRDHKAVNDDDQGPNTGGMGTYSAEGILTPGIEDFVMAKVIRPTVDGMQSEGTPFRGILYAGLMLTSKGPKVLEFNVRMGDPECQVILPRLQTDFGSMCEALSIGTLGSLGVSWNKSAAVCVVLASGGYPGVFPKGKVITGLDLAEEDRRVTVFHAATRQEGKTLVTDGGRVLGVTALADDLASSIASAYEAVNKIHFEGMHCRRDIGAKGLGPLTIDD